MNFRVLIFPSVLCSLLLSVEAAEPMSLDNLIHRGLTANRGLLSGEQAAEAARGRVEQAGLRANPFFEASVQNDVITGNNGSRKGDLSFGQAFPLGGRLREAQAVARVGIGTAIATQDNRRRVLAAEITQQFLEVLGVDRQIAIRDRLIETSRRLVDLSRSRAKVGEVSPAEVNAAALEEAKLEQERFRLVSERADKLQTLKPLIGAPPDEALDIVGEIDEVIQSLKASADGDQSSWNRADIRLAKLEIEQIDAEQRFTRAEAKGDITVGATYSYDRSVETGTDHLLGAKISIPIPIRNKNQGRLRELRAERIRAQRELEALEFNINSEVSGARQRADRLEKIIQGYQAAVVPLGETAERDLSAAFQQGQIPLFQLIQSQQQRLAIEAGALESRIAYARALAELQAATGRNPQLLSSPANREQP